MDVIAYKIDDKIVDTQTYKAENLSGGLRFTMKTQLMGLILSATAVRI